VAADIAMAMHDVNATEELALLLREFLAIALYPCGFSKRLGQISK